MLDRLLVTTVLLASVVGAVASLGPRSVKWRLRRTVAAVLRSAPRWARLHGLVRRQGVAATPGGGSCGGCQDCGTAASDGAAASASGAEIHVAVGTIPKRRPAS